MEKVDEKVLVYHLRTIPRQSDSGRERVEVGESAVERISEKQGRSSKSQWDVCTREGTVNP